MVDFVRIKPKINGFILKNIGIGNCDENDSLIFLFEDDTKLEISMWNKFNCESKAYFNLTDNELKDHYLNYGIKENRLYKDFSINIQNQVQINNKDDKINFIDYIVYINYFNCTERNLYMKKLLNNISIPNILSESINMTHINEYKLLNIRYKYKMTLYETAQTLSHIKAINYLKNRGKDYYMIMEDNISLDNLKFFKKNLKNIILEAPKFDILILYKKNKLNYGIKTWNS
jgi:hypothetical protein